MALEAWQERMMTEREELHTKLVALGQFIGASAFAQLPQQEQDRLWRQRRAMTEYATVLQERIEAWTPRTLLL